jgi:hypothetical protein
MSDDTDTLQAQIVTLRLRIDQQGEAMAALVRHYVEHEIANVMKGRLPTPEVTLPSSLALLLASIFSINLLNICSCSIRFLH